MMPRPNPTPDAARPLAAARAVFARNLAGAPVGLTSVCSAHPLVLRAALRAAHDAGQIALIEATCNQVNQDGRYTGMRPADFVALVRVAAHREGVPIDRVLLGGDHLGPQPWRERSAAEAMERAETMVAAYVTAGFTKIHLDCSMRCADDPEALSEATVAGRAARLARAAEAAAAAAGPGRPIYVIGSEVPPPGGMGEGHDIVATDPAYVATTWQAHRAAFDAARIGNAFARVCAVVVQPGLDFGNETVVAFDAPAAAALSEQAAHLDGAVFEAHSTDYQRPAAYAALVSGHFGILKVGPAATFALREALYSLSAIAAELWGPDAPDLRASLEAAMLRDPRHWKGHYAGGPVHLAWLRHFSWSDRVRYYWMQSDVQAAVDALFARLDAAHWPLPLVSQYLPRQYDALADGTLAPRCEAVVTDAVAHALFPYLAASDPHPPVDEDT